jgi:glycogen debranching enzyme
LVRHLETAEGCLSWIDEYGDRDGDGFQEYQTRSPVGYENMGWKDSGDAVVYPDGSLVKGPKALCELQGYVYAAWVRMAEVFDALGKPDRAQALRAKAAALFERYNAAFLDEELGFYAYALDGEKRKVLTVASKRRTLPVVRHRAPRPRQESCGSADGAGHVDRMGYSHALRQ